ncbi:MAG: FkbM family methyltransferase [Bacteroidota bacterium]
MKATLKKWIKKIPIAFTKNQRYDQLTARIIKAVCTEQSNCIDIGCHSGEVLDIILKYAPNGTHYCFEPIPELYEGLVKDFPSNCKFYQIGLSNEVGTTTFNHVLSNPAYSGFEQRQYPTNEERVVEIHVQKERLDTILPKNTPIDLIKIDVEGAEMQVLQGAVQTIKRCKPVIVFEHGKGAADYYGTTPREVYHFFKECGMKVMFLEAFFGEQQAMSLTEFERQFHQHLNHYFLALAV